MDTKEIMAEGLRAVAAYRDYEQSTPAADVMANTLAALSHRLDGVTVAWVSDDSETCDMCAYPESSRVYLRIGDTLVCQEHAWRGLVAVLGTHPRPAEPRAHVAPCACRCREGRHCGGCGHAGCGYRP